MLIARAFSISLLAAAPVLLLNGRVVVVVVVALSAVKADADKFVTCVGSLSLLLLLLRCLFRLCGCFVSQRRGRRNAVVTAICCRAGALPKTSHMRCRLTAAGQRSRRMSHSVTGVCLLLLACVCYMNFAWNRVKEGLFFVNHVQDLHFLYLFLSVCPLKIAAAAVAVARRRVGATLLLH